MAQRGHRHRQSEYLFRVSNTARGGAKHILTMCGERAARRPICPPNFISLFLSPFDTLARENPSRGEAAATKWPTTEHRCPKPSNPQVEDLEESGGAPALDSSPILHGSPGDLDSLGLVCTVADADTGRVEPSRVDAHEQGGVLPVTGAAPVLAEETAGVEPAGEAERAAAAKSEALAPWMQGETRREVKTLREGRCVHEPPPEALPRKREREVDKPNLRCCHESASASVPERGKNPNPKSRHRRERASANAARRRKATQTRANVSPAGRRESRRARTSCPLGRDQTLGSWREAAEGANFRVEKAR